MVICALHALEPALPMGLACAKLARKNSKVPDMTPTLFALYKTFWAVLGVLMVIVNYAKYRDLPLTTWKPGAAWTRAFSYFAFCNLVSIATGTFEAILAKPIFTAEQLSNRVWLTYAFGCVAYLFVAYWMMWARMTLTFNRKFHLPAQLFFGLVWGLSTGQLLLSFYHVWSFADLPGFAHYLLAYVSMGLWQYSIQDYWWDIYISPEHDSPKSIMIKTVVCHIPNVAICLGFLVLYDNYFMFVAFQTFALVASTLFQKLPPPWAQGEFHAPMTQRGLFGMPRGLGYKQELDPKAVSARPARGSLIAQPAE